MTEYEESDTKESKLKFCRVKANVNTEQCETAGEAKVTQARI